MSSCSQIAPLPGAAKRLWYPLPSVPAPPPCNLCSRKKCAPPSGSLPTLEDRGVDKLPVSDLSLVSRCCVGTTATQSAHGSIAKACRRNRSKSSRFPHVKTRNASSPVHRLAQPTQTGRAQRTHVLAGPPRRRIGSTVAICVAWHRRACRGGTQDQRQGRRDRFGSWSGGLRVSRSANLCEFTVRRGCKP